MTTIQTLCVFVSGFFLSRLVLRAGVHLRFISWIIRSTGGRLSRIVLGLMVSAFLLSTVIPNLLTVLALIPVVTRLREGGGNGDEARDRGLGTLLAIGLIYGANLGGVGSLIGSPANLYLLLNLELFAVDGREALHFASWLVFGLPMAGSYLLLCWGMLCLTERSSMGLHLEPWRTDAAGRAEVDAAIYAVTVRWVVIWALFWVVAFVLTAAFGLDRATLAQLALGRWRLPISLADLIAAGATAVFAAALFLVPQAGQRRLMTPRDLVREVPIKGVLLGLGVVVLLVLVARSGAVDLLERLVPRLVPSGVGPLVTTLTMTMVTIFATEVMNNTTVSTVLFPLSIAIARQVGSDPLQLMLGVSLASTCAFMTPVATPVNALAFGGVGKVSLGMLLKNGALANVLGAVWIALWLTWIIPPVLQWFS